MNYAPERILLTCVSYARAGGVREVRFDPAPAECRIRFRVGGVLRTSFRISREAQESFARFLKRQPNLRMGVDDGGEKVQVRATITPFIYGNRIVLELEEKRGNHDALLDACMQPGKVVMLIGSAHPESERLFDSLHDDLKLRGKNPCRISSGSPSTMIRAHSDVALFNGEHTLEHIEAFFHAALMGRTTVFHIGSKSFQDAMQKLNLMGIPSFLLESGLTCYHVLEAI